jgi:hypothetical protein
MAWYIDTGTHTLLSAADFLELRLIIAHGFITATIP